jgi:hypothetical protein
MPTQQNGEPVVKCPVEGCEAEKLSRGIHLHARQSKGSGHGTQGEVPEDVDLNNLERVGSKEVEMDYPDTREVERIGRICPYCDTVLQGKQGVMIHLGRMAGEDGHPEHPRQKHDLEDFAIARVDGSGDIIDRTDSTLMPSTERRLQAEEDSESSVYSRIRDYIEDLEERGKQEEAERAKSQLLGK